MKTLLILRHAKSSWSDAGLPDHDRPLNERGKRDAPRMGQLLREEQLVPDRIVSSTAKRARKTAAKVAKASGYQGEISLHDELYHGDIPAALNILRQLPVDAKRALLVGHNPDLEHLLELFTSQYAEMPTAALAQVEIAIDGWSELADEPDAKLIRLWRPRELPE